MKDKRARSERAGNGESTRGERMSRREILRGAAAAGVAGAAAAIGFPYIVPSSALGKDGAVAPSNRVVLGCIGVGGQGTYDMNLTMACPDAQVVAVCDVKTAQREAARDLVDKHYGGKVCQAYNDFRELLAREDIDAVNVASPDHWHVLHALAAVRAGKDVYLEKPMGLSLQEDFTLREAVKRCERVFQFGTQQRSFPQFRQACELVLNGRIGKLQTIKVSAPSGYAERTNESTYATAPVPEGFDYELWLGPAPKTPYTPKRVVTPFWFHNTDHALGYVAGWGIHHVDIAQWGNGTELSGPVEIEGSGVFPDNEGLCDAALNWDLMLKYANGVTMHYTSDGGVNKHGITFQGSDGWVYVNREVIITNPGSLKNEKMRPEEIRLPVSTNHQQNFLDCVKSREKPVANIEVAVRSDTICHLSDIAMRLGRKLQWDPEAERFVNDDAANQRMRRAMRSPWHL